MIANEIAAPYAQALYQIAPSKKQMKHDLHEAALAIQDHSELRHFLEAPHISVEKKANVLKKIFESLLDPLLIKFILFVLKKGRISYLPDMSEAYNHRFRAESDVVDAELITAISIDANFKEHIKTTLENSYNKKVEIEDRVEPKIMGGLMLIIGNRMLDASVKNRLEQLKENLLSKGI